VYVLTVARVALKRSFQLAEGGPHDYHTLLPAEQREIRGAKQGDVCWVDALSAHSALV
jgi:hypothetical protein